VTALVGSSSFLDQDGLEHRSPLSSDTLMNNGSSGDIIMAGLIGLQYIMHVGVGLPWDCSRDNSEMNTMH